jgi:ribosomal protein S18 acetylase RimI-like enzyme
MDFSYLKKNWDTRILTLDNKEEAQKFIGLFEDFFQLCEGESGSAQGLLQACPSSKNPEKDKVVLGIYKQDQIIGLIDLIQDYPIINTWTIGYFLIHPDFRSQNIGTKFMEDLEKCLQKDKIHKLRCVVQNQNPRALSFWLNKGFKCVKEIQETLGALYNATYILEKKISSHMSSDYEGSDKDAKGRGS